METNPLVVSDNNDPAEAAPQRLPGMVVGNLGDPIKLAGLKLNGVVAETALTGSVVKVWTRLALTSDEPLFYRVVENIASVIAHHGQVAGTPINLNRSNSVLLVIRPDNSADIWVDTAAAAQLLEGSPSEPFSGPSLRIG
jgi:hypothetical protein